MRFWGVRFIVNICSFYTGRPSIRFILCFCRTYWGVLYAKDILKYHPAAFVLYSIVLIFHGRARNPWSENRCLRVLFPATSNDLAFRLIYFLVGKGYGWFFHYTFCTCVLAYYFCSNKSMFYDRNSQWTGYDLSDHIHDIFLITFCYFKFKFNFKIYWFLLNLTSLDLKVENVDQ